MKNFARGIATDLISPDKRRYRHLSLPGRPGSRSGRTTSDNATYRYPTQQLPETRLPRKSRLFGYDPEIGDSKVDHDPETTCSDSMERSSCFRLQRPAKFPIPASSCNQVSAFDSHLTALNHGVQQQIRDSLHSSINSIIHDPGMGIDDVGWRNAKLYAIQVTGDAAGSGLYAVAWEHPQFKVNSPI